jgi:hypothetical protein
MKKFGIIKFMFIIAFFSILVIPILHADYKGGAKSDEENRYLASWPTLFSDGQLNFKGFEDWISDNIGGRHRAQSLIKTIDYKIFGIYGQSLTILGKKQWLYMATPDEYHEYQNTNLLTRDEADYYAQEYEKDAKAFKDMGIDFYLCMWPRKFTVYPEYMPDTFIRNGDTSDFDVLEDAFNNRKSLEFYTPRHILSKKKTERLTFSKSKDANHWSNYGAYLAYTGMMEKISEKYPQLQILQPEDFDITEQDFYTTTAFGFESSEKDLVYNLKHDSTHSDKDYFEKHEIQLKDTWHSWNYYCNDDNSSLPKVLIIGDSYVWEFLLQDISQSFSETAFIHISDYPQTGNVIQVLHPDIVICAALGDNIEGITSIRDYLSPTE